MKQRKNISKITLFTGLLMLNTTANSFYQCVPKKDWWLNLVREGSKTWKKIIHLTPQSPQSDFQQTLQAGKYRVTAAGGGGKPETEEFTLTSSQEFKACAGEKGQDAVAGESGKGGGGMGYNGSYESHGNGYGVVYSGNLAKCLSRSFAGYGGACVYGCYKGKNGNRGGANFVAGNVNSGGGAGGGSYFKVGNIEMIIKSGGGKDGTETEYGKGAAPDGYVIIERWE